MLLCMSISISVESVTRIGARQPGLRTRLPLMLRTSVRRNIAIFLQIGCTWVTDSNWPNRTGPAPDAIMKRGSDKTRMQQKERQGLLPCPGKTRVRLNGFLPETLSAADQRYETNNKGPKGFKTGIMGRRTQARVCIQDRRIYTLAPKTN